MSTVGTVRTRLAPSPTGTPHIGTMRQAIFDWLLARNTGGKFILRLEDTDQSRLVPESVHEIYDSLRWLGLEWDEGPEVGGPHAPYVQSQRLPLYQAAAKRLLDEGKAFECYCTPERLDAMRNQQRQLKQPPGYDGRCRSEAGRAEAKAKAGGRPPVVRFMTPDEGVTVVPDFLRGDVTFENARIDDAVLLKSDGFPTYHLAMVVDDHEMETSHVIRGEEWLSSAPLHKLVFDALGYELPVLVHTPLILGPDRSKLSKRHGAQSVLEYRDQGYHPDAVFNFLALLGWSLDDHTEIISRDEFVRSFTLDRMIKSPAVFNLDKLDWINGEYMRALSDREFARYVIGWLERPESEGGLPDHLDRPLDVEYTAGVIPLVKERIKRGPEALNMMGFFFYPGRLPDLDVDTLAGKTYRDDHAKAALLLSEALVLAESLEDWSAGPMEEAYRELAERLEVKGGDLFGLMRVAITGRTVSPPLFQSMEILGRERCVVRMREATQTLQ
jgi:glutamyl-tRNA synthetase